MKTRSNPKWWNTEYDSAWDRMKAAVKRDWDQTKHDFGGDEPDTDQDVDDTVAQAAGKQPIPPRGEPTEEEIEAAYRFGYGARRHYRDQGDWDDKFESRIRSDWEATYEDDDDVKSWPRYRNAVRRGWGMGGDVKPVRGLGGNRPSGTK